MFDSLAQIPVQERWREQKHPMPIVGAIIRRDSLADNSKADYLLIRRIKDPYQGMWALVGGKWDFGETMVEAIIREVKEETGLETNFIGLRGVVSERMAPANVTDVKPALAQTTADNPAHFLIFVCELVVTAGTAREQDEGEVGWFSTAELETLHQKGAVIPSDYAMLQRFVGAAAVPFTEIEMVVDGQGKPSLQQFKEILG